MARARVKRSCAPASVSSPGRLSRIGRHVEGKPPVKILDCHEMAGVTALLLEDRPPLTGWHVMVIDGVRYDPVGIMDAGKNVIAVQGSHDLTGKEVEFV